MRRKETSDATQRGGSRSSVSPSFAAADVRVYLPSELLQPYITFFYFVSVGVALTDFLYPEWGNVRFAMSGKWDVFVAGYETVLEAASRLFGPTDRPGQIVTPGGETIGFGMTPLGWHRLLGDDAACMANRIFPLGRRLGFDGDALYRDLSLCVDDAACVEKLEDALRGRLSAQPEISARILAVDRALRMRPNGVVAFAKDAGISVRSLNRICLKAFGFPPKRLMRLQRFLDTLGQVRTAIGGSVKEAIDDAYFDQSHFYRDFRDFMGMTPRAYFRADRPIMAPAAIAQTKAGVTLSFRLPPAPDEDD